MDSICLKCYFVGYSLTQKAYRFRDPIERKIKISRDVIFDEMNENITYPAPIKKSCSSSDRPLYISPAKTQQLSSVMGSTPLTPQVEEGTEAIQPDQQSINSTITGPQSGLPDLSPTEIIRNDHYIPEQSKTLPQHRAKTLHPRAQSTSTRDLSNRFVIRPTHSEFDVLRNSGTRCYRLTPLNHTSPRALRAPCLRRMQFTGATP